MTQKALRIGQISYTNTLPIYFYFDQRRFMDKIDFIQQVPAQLNVAMSKGEIDVGPISSFSYAEHESDYLILPNLSVSAKGKVRSIFLFSKRPLTELDGARIALTNTSATSVNLLKVILEKFHSLTVHYETFPPILAKMMEKHDAALLIGDEALLAHRTNDTYFVYDLAEVWYECTGFPMTFAVWAVRKSVIREHATLLCQVHEAFLASKERSLRNLREVVYYALDHFGGDAEFWHTYFCGLQYDFTNTHKEGLEYYFTSCAELGLLHTSVKVLQWEVAANSANTTFMS